MNRRQFAATMGVVAVAGVLRAVGPEAAPEVYSNVYPWKTFATRLKKTFEDDFDGGLAEVKKTGLTGFEPVLTKPEHVTKIAPLLQKHGLLMKSFYINSKLHIQADADASIQNAIAVAAAAKELGATVVVTNPAPIRWSGPENKTDDQLKLQAEKLDELGAALRKQGQTLAYHNHDIELRLGAREFHHMLAGTDPANVKFCLDAHWVYRGSGDSQVALFDVLKLYGSRIVELHLRQSVGGVWTETFTTGDIDYPKLWATLKQMKITPLLVLEQAVEEKSANTLSATEAHKLGTAYARKIFV